MDFKRLPEAARTTTAIERALFLAAGLVVIDEIGSKPIRATVALRLPIRMTDEASRNATQAGLPGSAEHFRLSRPPPGFQETDAPHGGSSGWRWRWDASG
jgi:hypothetical protein